eukprot:CAMPEP_0206015224 /NCGR_PEP_ID=MMETSP1464-20131121/19673_1 /ASSEMBLY_ACC=CAM_ASM_001124 /TAXON_ID=119497 /ORGANISM="Exanthemachrysis gayraliae, Strain RCC1523" /LENGTH=135 /DNA_ID=CAMNT_0053389013 /DNA_START=1 /DNA_END=409 /DNA_ORIENTATION=+
MPTKALFGIGEGLSEQQLDHERVRASMDKESARLREEAAAGDRKRGYNSMRAEEVTAEDMEAYYLTKRRADDPMAAMGGMGDGELLEHEGEANGHAANGSNGDGELRASGFDRSRATGRARDDLHRPADMDMDGV